MRQELLISFLKQHGWHQATCQKLAQDASFRTYSRLSMDGKTAVLMDAPAPERPDKFVMIDSVLSQTGARVPHILAQDLTNGFVLLEDFGDNTFTRLLNTGADIQKLYLNALDALITVQNHITPAHLTDIQHYDMDLMLFEVSLFTDWYIKYALDITLDASATTAFKTIWTDLIARIQRIPQTLVLLDYHVDNLMITPDNQCGLLDFQDARVGPITYDLMSLIEDARRPIPDDVYQAVLSTYIHKMPLSHTPDFMDMCVLTAVQRHTKVIGIFTRLCVRDKKETYLKHIPFIWSLLEKHLTHPLLQPYKDWLDTYIPADKRHTIPVISDSGHKQ